MKEDINPSTPKITIIRADKPEMNTDRLASASVSISPLDSVSREKSLQGWKHGVQNNMASYNMLHLLDKKEPDQDTADQKAASSASPATADTAAADETKKVQLIKVAKPSLSPTAIQHASKHFDLVMAIDIHWTQIPPPPSFNILPLPLPHPFIGMVFDPMDYIRFTITLPDFLQKAGFPASIPLGGSIYVHGRHKATTTTSVMGIVIPKGHITGKLPMYKIALPNEAPHDGEVYYGSQTVLAQGAKMSGAFAQQVLTCMGVPFGMTMLPTMPDKPKSFLSYLAFYNNFSSMYIQINTGKPVLVGGAFVPHQYTPGEMLMRLAGMFLIKKLSKWIGGKMKQFAKSAIGQKALCAINRSLKSLLGENNPLSKRLSEFGFDPVNFVTGAMHFGWTDFELRANTSIVWKNTWYSDRDFVHGMLGRNVFNSYDLFILPDYEEGIAGWINPDENMPVAIPVVETGEAPFYYRPLKIWIERPDEATWKIRHNHHVYTYTLYSNRDNEDVFKVKEIIYDDGTVVKFTYAGSNKLLRFVEDDSGRKIELVADADNEHILEVYSDYEGHRTLEVRYEYDKRGNLTHVWDKHEKCICFNYNDKNLVVKRINRNGMEYVFEHDKQGRVIYTSGSEGFQEGRIAYHTEEGYTEVIYPQQQYRTERYYYDENQLIYKKVDGEGGETWYDYTAFNERKMVASPEGRVQSFEYDEWGNVNSYRRPDGEAFLYQYNTEGRMIARITPSGEAENWVYDEAGRLLQYRNEGGTGCTFYYNNEQRQPEKSIAESGIETTYLYNKQKRLVQLTNSLNEIQIWKYDDYGNLLSFSPRSFKQVAVSRDTMGRVVALKQSGQPELTIKYDSYDLPVYVTDGEWETFMEYTPMGSIKKQVRKHAISGVPGRTLIFNYDAYENLNGVINEKKESYILIRNKNNELIEERGFDGQRKVHVRDADGLITRTGLSNGVNVNYEYDLAGRLVHARYNNGSWETYQYNSSGLLSQVENEHNKTQYFRNSAGLITREQQGSHFINYEYDKWGNLLKLESSLGAMVQYDYDDLGRATQLQAFDRHTIADKLNGWRTSFEYDDKELKVLRRLSGGIDNEFISDYSGRPVSQKIEAGSSVVSQKKYSWGKGLELMQTLDLVTGGLVRYQYDVFSNLTAAWYAEEDEMLFKTSDEVKNIYKTEKQHDRTYDKGGKLLSDETFHYYYDGAGSLTLKTKRKLTFSDVKHIEKKDLWQSGDWFYEWNDNGTLKQCKRPDGKVVEMEYDVLRRRTAKIYNGKITRFVWNGNVVLHQWTYDLKDRPQLVVDAEGRMSYDKEEPTPELITWVYESNSYVPCAKLADGKRYAIVADYMGRPTHAFGEEGECVWETGYDIYGDVRNTKGDRTFIPFRQQGQYEDDELDGLYYNRYRYYDVVNGRYISADPLSIAGGLNVYAYVKNVNAWVDIFGLAEDLTLFPTNLLFGQKRIAPQFQSMNAKGPEILHGRDLESVADDLAEGRMSPDIFEIRYTQLKSGELVTLNNRGLAVLEMAGVKPEYAIFVPYNEAPKHLLSDIGEAGFVKGEVLPSDKIAVTVNKDGSGKLYEVHSGKRGPVYDYR